MGESKVADREDEERHTDHGETESGEEEEVCDNTTITLVMVMVRKSEFPIKSDKKRNWKMPRRKGQCCKEMMKITIISA